MNANSTILEFDFAPKRSRKRIGCSILVRIIPFVLVILFSSYQKPDEDVVSFQITYRNIDFQCDLQSAIYSMADYTHDAASQDIASRLNNLVKVFYENIDFEPVWTSIYDTNPHFKGLKDLLDSAKYLGFPIDYFDSKRIKTLSNEFSETRSLETRIELEMASTYSAFKLMLFINRGIIENEIDFSHLDFVESLPKMLSEALQKNDLKGDILALQPDLAPFHKIVGSLPNFIDLHLSIKFTTPKFIDDRMLAKGLYYAGITETAEIDSNETNAKAILALQQKYHLPKDSVLNRSTHEVLVSLLEYRYYQACLNLNRLRALQNTEENFLFVNIPEFKLHVVESRQEMETFNVIVGKTTTPTPVFSSTIEKVITNPYWTVPKSILNDMLHKIRKDSTYLEKNGYYVINGREQLVDISTIDWNSGDPLGTKYYLRQKSSPSNALGLLKFIFPNEYNVYIHDTPSRGLFNQTNRTFSYGCIRLENPDKLAQYLTDKYFSEEVLNIKSIISSQQSREINLQQKVGVHIQYITCSGKENSDMEFYSDIYNLDKQEISRVFQNRLEI
jgi:hypothetical protein